MREIKFRLRLKNKGDGDVITVHTPLFSEQNGLMNFPVDLEEWEILSNEQYTGLTDRNGKEIYEGDIVTAREQSNKATFTGYVHFLNAQYWVNYIGYESYYVPLIQLHGAVYEQIEVIGNIYSNPELVSA